MRQSDHASAYRRGHCLGDVSHLEFLVDAPDVSANRMDGQLPLRRDLLVLARISHGGVVLGCLLWHKGFVYDLLFHCKEAAP